MNKINKKGFTLIELVIVITIIGVLSTVMIGSYIKYIDSSRQSVVDEQVQEIKQVLELAVIDAYEFTPKGGTMVVLDSYKKISDIGSSELGLQEMVETLLNSTLEGTVTYAEGTVTYTLKNKSASFTIPV